MELHVVEGQILLCVLGLAACHGPHPREQLLHCEGFAEVVVRAGVKPRDSVVNLGLCREHDYRCEYILRANLAQNLDAVFLRHHYVQNHAVIAFLVDVLHSFLAVKGGVNVVALVGEDCAYYFV